MTAPRRVCATGLCCVCGGASRYKTGRVCNRCYKRAERAERRICVSTYHEGSRILRRSNFPRKASASHGTHNVCVSCNHAAQRASINRAVIPASDPGSTHEYAELRRAQLALIFGRIP